MDMAFFYRTVHKPIATGALTRLNQVEAKGLSNNRREIWQITYSAIPPSTATENQAFVVRTDTAHIYVPGHQLPARVEFTRPRWWPLSLLLLGAVIGTAFVVTRLLAKPCGDTRDTCPTRGLCP